MATILRPVSATMTESSGCKAKPIRLYTIGALHAAQLLDIERESFYTFPATQG